MISMPRPGLGFRPSGLMSARGDVIAGLGRPFRRGGAVAARGSHKPEVVGSSPTPATIFLAHLRQPDCRLSGPYSWGE